MTNKAARHLETTVNTGASNEDLSAPNFSAGSVECAENYHGTASAIKCTINGSSYSVSGCSAIMCERPIGDAAIGYVFDNDEILSAPNFSAGSLECAGNYYGPASATKCTTNGSSYSVSGCSAKAEEQQSAAETAEQQSDEDGQPQKTTSTMLGMIAGAISVVLFLGFFIFRV